MWREEKSEEANIKASRFGIVAAVGIAFFVAEFGDKTQLATLSLAAQYQSPLSVLFGATLAILLADGIGIIIGAVFCRRIPQHKLKWLSAIIFVLFGLVGVYEVLSNSIGLDYTAVILSGLTVVSVCTMYTVAKRQKPTEEPKQCKKAP